MQQWQGPLPPPAALQQFDQIVPHGAERIFAMVEQEQAQRIKFDAEKLAASTADFRRGSWMGFVLALACVAGAVFTAYIGAHSTVSVALVSVPIMGAVVKFLRK
jgi:uncharacterized membrane protein